MSIINNKNRVGNISSSNAYKLIPNGKREMTSDELCDYKKNNPKGRAKTIEDDTLFSSGGYTYIKELRQERKRKRSLSMDISSQSTDWGDIMERRVFDMIGIEYHDTSQITYTHPNYPDWVGSPDLLIPNDRIGDIKGYEPKNFCNYADCIMEKDVKKLKENFPKEYWQLGSNACIHNVDTVEILLYQPYDNEAGRIMEIIDRELETNPVPKWGWKNIYDKLMTGELWRLPFQPDDSDYPNLVTWDFVFPKEDKLFLEKKIKSAIKLLNE